MLDEVVAQYKKLARAAKVEAGTINPKAVYVVEKSNPPRGSKEIARPISIWHHLREKRIPAEQIAVYTQTKQVPEEAEKIVALTALEPRHHHIIFNQALQEGWDDPEAYLCYFDEETKSYVRIQQIVGRVLRQPNAQHASNELLNTATLFVRVPNANYEEVIAQIKDELSLYTVDDGDPFGTPGIRLKTRIIRRSPLCRSSPSSGTSCVSRTTSSATQIWSPPQSGSSPKESARGRTRTWSPPASGGRAESLSQAMRIRPDSPRLRLTRGRRTVHSSGDGSSG